MVTNICDSTILCRKSLSYKEFRALVKKWLKENYFGKSFINLETGYDIVINNTFIEKVTSSLGDVKAHSFTAIADIIKNAAFINSESDKRGRLDIIRVLKFESKVLVGEMKYEIWLYVRQTKKEFQLYSINIDVSKNLT